MSDVNFDESSFWEKIKNFALRAGREVIEKALWLYYASKQADTPAWANAIIYSALAYFILPIDAIPDVTPIVGYTDDLGALGAAIGAVSLYITKEVKVQTSQKLADWFD